MLPQFPSCASLISDWKNKYTGLNIGADKEAAEHFLSALSMQESASGEKSEQLWFTLRRALIQIVCLPYFERPRHMMDSRL